MAAGAMVGKASALLDGDGRRYPDAAGEMPSRGSGLRGAGAQGRPSQTVQQVPTLSLRILTCTL
jgi:hypothetical protein